MNLIMIVDIWGGMKQTRKGVKLKLYEMKLIIYVTLTIFVELGVNEWY